MKNQIRVASIREWMDEKGMAAMLLASPNNQFYVSNYKAIIYSRPLFYVLGKSETAFIVPGLEEKHARSLASVDQLFVYYEHPEMAHKGTEPVDLLMSYLGKPEAGAKLGIEFNTIPIKLAKALEAAGWELVDVASEMLQRRTIKDETELHWMRYAGKLVSNAVRASLSAVQPGVSELEVDDRGRKALLLEAAEQYPKANVFLNAITPSGLERS
ncbi:aminopeptidase P family protein [Brevibacillus sp. FIR094]|uniref:aminopeptidase P family protein n=1 Tax=Brevibacillus sp. FIR094 TaxID=3134809 RepID=UPI003D228484